MEREKAIQTRWDEDAEGGSWESTRVGRLTVTKMQNL